TLTARRRSGAESRVSVEESVQALLGRTPRTNVNSSFWACGPYALLTANQGNGPVQYLVASLSQTGHRRCHRHIRLHAHEVVRRVAVVSGHAHAGKKDSKAAGYNKCRHVPIGTGGGAPNNRPELTVGHVPEHGLGVA